MIIRRILNIYSSSLFGAALFLLAGCATAPENQFASADLKLPEEWSSEEKAVGEVEAQSGWIADFADEQLVGIVSEALEHNRSLQAAAARLDIARSVAWVEGVAQLPVANLNTRGSRALNNRGERSDSFGLSLGLSWELDLWGKIRNGKQAGMAEWRASQEDYRAAQLSIAARTVKAWYAAVEAQLQLELARRTLKTYESNLQTVEENYRSGVARSLDVRLLRANLAGSQSAVEQRLRASQSSTRQLETLLGRYPSKEIELAMVLPELVGEVPAGLPSELLSRRPDLIASERRLAAALMSKKEARKKLLPSISLSASGGTSSSDIGDLTNDAFKVWNLAYNVVQPLFPTKAIRAGVVRAKATHELALANFANTMLTAFQEVEVALDAQASYTRDFMAQQMAAEESIAAEELAWEQYEYGLADIATVLESQRRSFNTQRSLIQVTNQRLQSRVDLYLALGGGFVLEN